MAGQNREIHLDEPEYTEDEIVNICHKIAQDFVSGGSLVNLALMGARIMLQAIKEKYENRGEVIPARVLGGVIAMVSAAHFQGVDHLLIVPE